MTKNSHLDFFQNKQKAIDHCMWLNFKYRIPDMNFGIIHGPENNWAVLEEAVTNDMACRGYDENHRWVGFAKAHEIWKTTE